MPETNLSPDLPPLFQDLPATFPTEDRFLGVSAIASVVVNGFMLTIAILIPLIFTSSIPNLRLLVYTAPPPVPTAEPTIAVLPGTPVAIARARPTQPSESTLIAPVAVPEKIARIVDVPVPAAGQAGFGVAGGMPGVPSSAIFRDIVASPLSSKMLSEANALPLPPPPEPAVVEKPQAPIRLKGFQALKTIRATPPEYPRVAKASRIEGAVILDVTLNENGEVEDIHVLSGHPLLIQAAVDCVRNWLYEPPVVNGKPVRVILPVRLNFKLQL